MPSFFSELSRRNVIRVAIFYVVTAWLVLQIGDVLFSLLEVPDWTLRFVFGVTVLGFPLVVGFAWAYEITPEGIRRESEIEASESISRETARRLDLAVLGALGAVALLTLVQITLRDHSPPEPVKEPTGITQTETSALQPGASNSESALAAPEKSIAVLPFADMSVGGDQAYFADGIAEELLNQLARLDGLKVAARTSSFKFRDGLADASEIGQALDVATVLEGSVRKAGEQVRITAQLIDTANGYHIWSDTFDRKLEDIFAIQDEISREIVTALQIELMDGQVAQPPANQPDSVAAYDKYLLGRHYFHQRTDASLRKAIELFQQVVEADPDYAPAWSGLADAYMLSWQYGDFDPTEAEQKAYNAAQKAVELAPGLAEARASWGLAHFGRDKEKARDELQKAIELNPGYSMGHMWLGNHYNNYGHTSDALAAFEKAYAVDPLHPIVAENVAGMLSATGRYEESARIRLEALKYNPGSANLYTGLAASAMEHGRLVDAHRYALQALGVDERSPYALSAVINTEIALGRMESAEYWLDILEKRLPKSIYAVQPTAYLMFQRGEGLKIGSLLDSLGDFAGFSAESRFLHIDALLAGGQHEEALRVLEEADFGPFDSASLQSAKAITEAMALRKSGENELARESMQSAANALDRQEELGSASAWIPYNRAFIHAFNNDRDAAMAALERAFDKGWRHYYGWNGLQYLDEMMAGNSRYSAWKGKVLADIARMREEVESVEKQV